MFWTVVLALVFVFYILPVIVWLIPIFLFNIKGIVKILLYIFGFLLFGALGISAFIYFFYLVITNEEFVSVLGLIFFPILIIWGIMELVKSVKTGRLRRWYESEKKNILILLAVSLVWIFIGIIVFIE